MTCTEPFLANPTFVLALHRSGGTVLSRILNCHPAICIWGEHGGFINKFAEIEAILSRGPAEQASDRLAQYAEFGEDSLTTFDPWISPVSLAGFREWARSFIGSTFSMGLPRGSRWGFKEIRYHSVTTAEFLIRLFPLAQFIILRRDMEQLCVSNIFARWSIKELLETGVQKDLLRAREAIQDCAYALVAIDRGLLQIAEALPNQSRTIRYEDLASKPQSVITSLFEFLELPPSLVTDNKIHRVLSVKSGRTDRDQVHGLLTRDFVESLAPQALAEARLAIDTKGVDLVRLKRLGPCGQYSYLVGDHPLRRTSFSSMF
jgi:hypothetical protein